MKNLLISACLLILVACGKTNDQSGHNHDGDANGDNPNKALYDQVMDIHDEVMPKMEDLYKAKKALEERIAANPNMAADQKKELEGMISGLDSANMAMMDWMHNFNPLPDSVDQEAAREYLETEMERIRKVRDLTNETLEKVKSAAEKKE